MPLGAVLGLVVLALPILAAIVSGRRSGTGFERIVRCSAGHLFTSIVVPGASIKAVRLLDRRLQWCPVGRHWTLVRTVDEAVLTPAERDSARSVHDTRVP
jgi:hypothetical protein